MKTLAAFLLLVSAEAFAQSQGHYTRYPATDGSGTVTDVTATLPLTVTNGTTTPAIALPPANATTNGYLASGDWVLFNGAAPTARNINTTAPITGGGNLSADRTIAMPVATSTANGYLASTDWVTFNGKQGLLTPSSTVNGQNFEIYPSDSATHHVEMTMTPGGSVSYQMFWPSYAPSPGTTLVVDSFGFFQWASGVSTWLPTVKCVATNQSVPDWIGEIVDCDNFYAPVEGDRFLVAGFPATPELEGIYVVNNDGSFSRTSDANTGQLLNGIAVQVSPPSGGFNGDGRIFTQVNNIATVDTDAQKWVTPQPSFATSAGTCSVSSSTVSTTPSTLTCSSVPASTAVAVNCSGSAAFSTATADALYCRATGTANQIACNTTLANVTAMTFACSWIQP